MLAASRSNNSTRGIILVSNVVFYGGVLCDEKYRSVRVHDGSCYAVIFTWGLVGAPLSAPVAPVIPIIEDARAICIIPFAVR